MTEIEAKKYKKTDYGIYKWDVVNKTRLIKMSEENRVFFKKLFMNTKDNIKPFINHLLTFSNSLFSKFIN